jgi:hypothetical protein
MMKLISTPVTGRQEAIKLLAWLSTENLLYHPEDDANDIMLKSPCPSEGGPDTFINLFTKEQGDLLNTRMDEVFEHMDDPCQWIMDTIYNGSI